MAESKPEMGAGVLPLDRLRKIKDFGSELQNLGWSLSAVGAIERHIQDLKKMPQYAESLESFLTQLNEALKNKDREKVGWVLRQLGYVRRLDRIHKDPRYPDEQ